MGDENKKCRIAFLDYSEKIIYDYDFGKEIWQTQNGIHDAADFCGEVWSALGPLLIDNVCEHVEGAEFSWGIQGQGQA